MVEGEATSETGGVSVVKHELNAVVPPTLWGTVIARECLSGSNKKLSSILQHRPIYASHKSCNADPEKFGACFFDFSDTPLVVFGAYLRPAEMRHADEVQLLLNTDVAHHVYLS